MRPILQNLFGIILGIIIGSSVNMVIVTFSGEFIPLPEGINPDDVLSLKENIHRFKIKHYIMPFLAHALGTLVGAFVASKIALTRKKLAAYVIGLFFLFGGISAAQMIGTPIVPTAVDLVFAYIPMAWFGNKLAHR